MGFIFYGIFPIDFMNAFRQFIKLFNHTFTIGESISFTPKSILIVILVFVMTSLLLKIFRKIIYRTLSDDARVKFKSIFSFFNYFVYTVVVLLTFQNIGVNLTAVFAASAALLVGVGLALQTFIQDIISGIFILVDQSVHVGDIIEVDIPKRIIRVDISDGELKKRREAMVARGSSSWQPKEIRTRIISKALKAYGLMATSADKGAVRSLDHL